MKTLGKSRYLNWVSVKLESNLWSEIDLKPIRLISRRNVPWRTIWLGVSVSIWGKIQILLKCEHLVIVSLLIVFTVSDLLIGDISRVSSYLSLIVQGNINSRRPLLFAMPIQTNNWCTLVQVKSSQNQDEKEVCSKTISQPVQRTISIRKRQ